MGPRIWLLGAHRTSPPKCSVVTAADKTQRVDSSYTTSIGAPPALTSRASHPALFELALATSAVLPQDTPAVQVHSQESRPRPSQTHKMGLGTMLGVVDDVLLQRWHTR